MFPVHCCYINELVLRDIPVRHGRCHQRKLRRNSTKRKEKRKPRGEETMKISLVLAVCVAAVLLRTAHSQVCIHTM